MNKSNLLLLLPCIYSCIGLSTPLKIPCDTNEPSKYKTNDCDECHIQWHDVTIKNKITVYNDFINSTDKNIYIEINSIRTSFQNLQPESIYFHPPTQTEIEKSAEKYYFNFPALNKNLFKFKLNQKARLFTTNLANTMIGSQINSDNNLYINRISNKYNPNDYSLKMNYQLEYMRAAPGTPPNLNEKERLNTCVFIRHVIKE